jgi:hypothetical protein
MFKGKILGDVTQYSVACTCFSDEIFEKSDKKQIDPLMSEEAMKNYFASFSVQSNDDQKENNVTSKFMAKRIYKGYRDDPRNTGFNFLAFIFSSTNFSLQ